MRDLQLLGELRKSVGPRPRAGRNIPRGALRQHINILDPVRLVSTQDHRLARRVSDKISTGADSFSENIVGGPAVIPMQSNPAVTRGDTGGAGAGFITVLSRSFLYRIFYPN